jgi:DNA polymerase-1
MSWTLPKMEDLSRYKEIVVDTETSGLSIWDGHRTVGTALGLVKDDGSIDCRYYPYGHDGGAQYTRGDVMAFLNKELRDKIVIGHNIPFDTLMLIQDGVDLRAHNNQLEDTMYSGILYNPEGYYSLDAMFAEFVDPNVQKVKLPFDKGDMEFQSSDAVGEYAEMDVRMTGRLHPIMQQKIKQKKLEEVYRLECDCISPTVEMQNNGLVIDTDKLGKWIKEVTRKVNGLKKKFGPVNPNSGKQLKEEFAKLGIEHPWNWNCPACTQKMKRDVSWPEFGEQHCPYCKEPAVRGSAHFGKKLLKRIDHKFVKQVMELKSYSRLLDAFMLPWSRQIKRGRILPFELNQLRDRDYGGSTKGTVTGRFSSSMPEEGSQPQQIWKVKNQIDELGDQWILRELFIAGNKDADVMDVDASQEEFRLLGHFSRTDKIANAYNNDPFVDYHDVVAKDILKGKMPRHKAKNINFGKIYGMGKALFSRMFDVPFNEAVEMYELYEKEFPEAKETDRYYDRQARLKGEVRTLRGRLFEFGRNSKTHIALSRLIQGSAGDLMKEAMVKCWKANIFDKMRLTVHDELLGDGDRAKGPQLVELLNDTKGIRVPIRWELDCGKNWAMRGGDHVQFK